MIAAGRVWYHSGELLFGAGVLAWLAVLLVQWPAALSFGDEIGYLGQAKLFLEGRVHPVAGSPGIWNATPRGPVAQYPLLVSVLLAPLFAISPGAIFLSGTLAAIGLAWTGSRALKSWGHSPCWGLVFLAHPTVIILARTAMSDLLWSAFALGAWWSLRERRPVPAILLLAATMATKPPGFLVAGAIVVGEILESRRLTRRTGVDASPIKMGMVGLALGLILVVGSNELATGTVWFGYSFNQGFRPFRPSYFLTSAPTYARALFLNPPLLLVGLFPLWRRRLLAPLLVIVGLGGLMSFYYFVDQAPGFMDSLVLSERLILPVVAFLMVGYAAVLSTVATRLRLARIAAVLLVMAPALIAFKIGARHQGWQRPMREAREAARRMTRDLGSNELGLTNLASKAGLMFPGRTHWIVKDGPRPKVLLCVTHGEHFRAPGLSDPDEEKCDAAGYRRVRQLDDGYLLMLRSDLSPPGAGPPTGWTSGS